MELNLGPLSFRAYRGNGWWSAVGAVVTNRGCGLAQRESSIRASAKSEHLTDITGKDNPEDTFTCPVSGELFYGKTGFSPLSAQQVYAATLIKRAQAVGLQDAKAATAELANA
jgi:hypothetical protein